MENKRSIGELIREEVCKQKIPVTKFAKMICCERNNIYDIYKRDNINIAQLKLISQVLNRNFFKEIAKDMDLIGENNENEEEIARRKAVSQFLEVVPKVLIKLGKTPTIMFSDRDDPQYNGSPVPDFGLSGHYITFTIGETLKERLRENKLLQFKQFNDENGGTVEACFNKLCHSVAINIKLDYKSEEEWYNTMKLAFETHDKFYEKI